MLTLKNFQDTIDNTVVQRGWRYFKDKLVHDLEQDDDTWTATVYGSEEYEVEITIDTSGDITAWCDCPYDWGPYCKHVVAVLYAIRDDVQSGKKKAKSAKKSTETVQQMVENLSQAELVEIVMKQVKKDRALGNQLLLQYGKTPPGKQTYSAIIRDALHSHSDRGFLDYMGSQRAGRAVWEVISQAIAQIDAGEHAKAIPILQAVIETVAPALEQADDSSGDLGGSLEESIDLLQKAAETLPATEKHALFNYALQEAFEERHQGFDANWSLLHLAGEIATLQDRETFFAACDRMAETVSARHRSSSYYSGDDWHSNYAKQQALRLKQDFMRRAGDSPQSIEAFLLEHKHLDDSRKQLINLYIEQARYDEAQDLCLEGFNAAEKTRYRGLVQQYRELLLTIAVKQGNPQPIIEIAEQLFLESASFEHYETLKQYISGDAWSQYVKTLIRKVQQQYKGRRSTAAGEIYRREAMWERLREYVKANGIQALHAFQTDMEMHFPDDVITVYKETVYNGLKQSSSRDVYHQMTDYLRRIKQLGHSDEAYAIAEDLKTKYNNRPAMIDELNRL